MQYPSNLTHPALNPTPLPAFHAPPPAPLGDLSVLRDPSTIQHTVKEAGRLREWLVDTERRTLGITLSRNEFTVSSPDGDKVWTLERPRAAKYAVWALFAADMLLREFRAVAALRITVDFLGLVVSGVMAGSGVRTAKWATIDTLTIVVDSDSESLFCWPATYTAFFQLHGIVELAVDLGALVQSSDTVRRVMRWTRDFVARGHINSARRDTSVDVLRFRNVERHLAKDLNALACDPARGRCKSIDMWPKEEQEASSPGRVHVAYKNWGRSWTGIDEYLPPGILEEESSYKRVQVQ